MDQMPQMPPTLPGVVDLFMRAKEMVMKRWQFLMMLAFIPSVFSFLTVMIGSGKQGASLGVVFILNVIQVVTAIISAVAMIMGLGDESLNDVKKAYQMALPKAVSFVWAGLLSGIVSGLAYILLVVPGIYLTVAFVFVPFVVVLEGVRGWAAAKRSKEMVKGRWWALFGRLIALYVAAMVVASVIATVVGMLQSNFLLALMPVILMTLIWPLAYSYVFLIYRALKSAKA